jgi:dUTP pyrophosphatase
MKVAFKRLNPFAAIPRRASEHAAGYDLVYCGKENIRLFPGQSALITTGLAWAAPANVYGRIAARSGMAVRYGLTPLAGVIDADYRGEIMVLMICLGDLRTKDNEAAYVELEPGDKVAQLIIETYHTPDIEILEHNGAELPESARGGEGFGSSGA